jgi:hypothetical protein
MMIDRFQDNSEQWFTQPWQRTHRQVEEFVSGRIHEDLPRFYSIHFQELGLRGDIPETGVPSIRPDALLSRTIQSIRNSDYRVLLDLAAKLHDPSDRQSVLNVLEKAFSFSIASTNDPLLSAKFEDLQLSLIKLRRALNEKANGNGRIGEMVGDLEDKLRSSRDVYLALEELGLSTTEIFGNFEMKNLPDGKVQYVWKNSGLDKESHPK